MRMTRRAGAVLVVLLAAGCAPMTMDGQQGRDQSVITREEINRANQLNALEVVRTERPHWLRIRGSTSFEQDPEIVVYLDGVRAGNSDILAEIAAINVEEIRYYEPRQAQFRFGVGHVHGAIEVVTRKD